MKILMVNKFLKPKGGSETYIIKIGDYLREQGHEVQYFGMEEEGRTLDNCAGLYTGTLDFHTSKWKKVLYPLSIIYSREAKTKIIQVLKAFSPDVVHLNNFNYQLTPSVIYGVKAFEKMAGRKIPIIYTAHDYQLLCPNHMMNAPHGGGNCESCVGGHYINCIKKKCIHSSVVKSVLGAMEAAFYHRLRTYRYIDLTICPSHFLESKMTQVSLFRGKTVTLHNFIDTKEAAAPARKKDYVLYFGRFSKEKGIETLLLACKQLPHISFVFAGEGPLETVVDSVDNVKNVGFIRGSALIQLIQEARFSIYPSEWYENCPFSVMESLTLSTPVLGARIGGIPELIQDGVDGTLFESGDCRDLKEKIEQLWNRPQICEAWAANCRKAQFDTVEQYCNKLLGLYQKTMESEGL